MLKLFSMASNRGWWRDYFTDHPLYDSRNVKNSADEAWASTTKDKPKVMCTRCLEHEIATQRVADETGGIPQRDYQEIALESELILFSIYFNLNLSI